MFVCPHQYIQSFLCCLNLFRSRKSRDLRVSSGLFLVFAIVPMPTFGFFTFWSAFFFHFCLIVSNFLSLFSFAITVYLFPLLNPSIFLFIMSFSFLYSLLIFLSTVLQSLLQSQQYAPLHRRRLSLLYFLEVLHNPCSILRCCCSISLNVQILGIYCTLLVFLFPFLYIWVSIISLSASSSIIGRL